MFDELKKKLAFGCMRLPMTKIDGKEAVDYEEFSKMADAFIDAGFNYFDTAHTYIGGLSETAIRDCVAKRHGRSEFLLTDKLSAWCFEKEEDLPALFKTQLDACGVDYFDFYLLHAIGKENYPHYRDCRAFEFAAEMKKQGKVRHVGFSFHDTPEFLEEVLTEHPEVEVVQLQFNYLDFNSPDVQSRACYEVVRKHGKHVLVMEPVRGGLLASLPDAARLEMDRIGGGSDASKAVRFAASFDGVLMVLSGMSNLSQMLDNLSEMRDFKPLSEEEKSALLRVADILHAQPTVPCTGCRYCVDGCPMSILIPDLFACYNAKVTYRENPVYKYRKKLTVDHGKASACIKCGACESSCPQHLPIRDLLEKVAEAFES